MPKLNTTTIWTPIFEWYMVACETKNGHQIDMYLKIKWTACSKYANHSRFNRQQD